MALTALALRAAPTRPPQAERRLVPAVDDADAAFLDRAAVSHQRAALIASLWPAPTRQCIVPPLYVELPAPALFGMVFRVDWRAASAADARALQQLLRGAFPAAPAEEAAAACLAA
jgi:hypothetical protein